RCCVSRMAHGRKPGLDQRNTFGRTVTRPAEDQGIGKTRDPETDPALGLRLRALCIQWKARHIDRVVEHPDRASGEPCQFIEIEMCALRERLLDKLCKIDRTQ